MILRSEHSAQKKFAIITRSLAQDKRLSFQARGLLLYVLSKPEGWKAKDSDLMKQGDIKKYAYASILKELKAAGYARRTEARQKGGEFGYSLEIYEEPQLAVGVESVQPLPDLPHTVEPLSDNPSTDNQVAPIDSTCVRAANTLSTDKRELREKQVKPAPPNQEPKPPKIRCPANMLEQYPEIREMFPDHNGSLDRIAVTWREFRLGQTRDTLRTEEQWYHDFLSWVSREKPNQNGNGANGKARYSSQQGDGSSAGVRTEINTSLVGRIKRAV